MWEEPVAGTAKSSGPKETLPVENPAPGAILTAPAGGRVDAIFDFENEAPFVAGFYLDVEGLPNGEWATGIGEDSQVMAAAYGGGTLTLSLTPPANAGLGEYALRIKVMSEGSVQGEGPVPLVLKVERGAPVPPPEVVTTAIAPAVAESPPPAPRTVSKLPEPKAEAPTAPEEPAPPQAPPAPTANAAPRETAKPVVLSKSATCEAKPAKATPAPEEPLPVVDLPEREEEEEEESQPVAERSVLNPKDGATLSLRPGETFLLRFTLTNDSRRERTYLIEEDRSLAIDWIKLVQDQVNVTHNGSGELWARLQPPINAEPGDYPFAVRIGPQGGVLTPTDLVLQVLPTPAVRLSCRHPVVSVGPFGRAVDFELALESAGNADTAYRVSVKDPLVVDAADGKQHVNRDLYETPQWRYLFDKELDNLTSAADRPPAPRPIRLRLWRKGVWWLGLRESHRVKVAAVPVTDVTNGGKEGNTVEVSAVRWRLLPIPGFVTVPLCFLVLTLLTSGAQDVRVTNGLKSEAIWYVLTPREENPREGEEPGKTAAHLSWQAPWYALLKMDASEVGKPPEDRGFVRGSFSGPVRVESYGNDETYSIHPFLAGSAEQVSVRFVPVKTNNRLQLSQGNLGSETVLPRTTGDDTVGEERVPIRAGSVTLPVGRSWTTLNIANTTKRSGSGALSVVLHVVKLPEPTQFETLNLKPSYNLDPEQTSGAIKIRSVGSGSDSLQELVFATTDAQNQLLHVKLETRP